MTESHHATRLRRSLVDVVPDLCEQALVLTRFHGGGPFSPPDRSRKRKHCWLPDPFGGVMASGFGFFGHSSAGGLAAAVESARSRSIEETALNTC